MLFFINVQGKPNAAENASPATQRRNEVTFLEHNLQQLTMNHKQVNTWSCCCCCSWLNSLWTFVEGKFLIGSVSLTIIILTNLCTKLFLF